VYSERSSGVAVVLNPVYVREKDPVRETKKHPAPTRCKIHVMDLLRSHFEGIQSKILNEKQRALFTCSYTSNRESGFARRVDKRATRTCRIAPKKPRRAPGVNTVLAPEQGFHTAMVPLSIGPLIGKSRKARSVAGEKNEMWYHAGIFTNTY
jgi:hypothetical protein